MAGRGVRLPIAHELQVCASSVFEIINKLIIGQVVNGKVTYLAQKKFNAAKIQYDNPTGACPLTTPRGQWSGLTSSA